MNDVAWPAKAATSQIARSALVVYLSYAMT
jgi:hypothetical protein